jgi:hypothetical protein
MASMVSAYSRMASRGAVFAPAGDVGDRLAADVESDRGADDVGDDAVDEHLALLAPVLAVAEPERMGELVK